MVNHKETPPPREKHITMPTGKIKSATVVTKKAIHILIFPTKTGKRTMTTTITSPVKKSEPVLKTCSNIQRRIIITSTTYKIIYKSLNMNNTTYHTQMESHTQVNFLYWRTNTRFWDLNIIQPNIKSSTTTERRDPFTIKYTWGQWSSLKMSLTWTYYTTQIWLKIKR